MLCCEKHKGRKSAHLVEMGQKLLCNPADQMLSFLWKRQPVENSVDSVEKLGFPETNPLFAKVNPLDKSRIF